MSGRARKRRVPPFWKIAIGVSVLSGLGSAAKAVVSPAPPPRCVFSCGTPPAGQAQAQGATFTSAKYGFTFAYPNGSAIRRLSEHGSNVFGLDASDGNGNFLGQMLVSAGTGAPSLTGLVESEVSKLGKANVTNLKESGPMLGAEVGFVPGQGLLYTGEYTDPSGNVYPVKVGIAAVQEHRDWVCVTGIGTVDHGSPTPAVFQLVDDVLDQWRWSR